MTDTTDQEHLDNPPHEIIPTKNSETINPILESKYMEVHHHPDLHHNPKKWKEYFLEFLMIFLAVTLGFFAENIREHKVEREREKEYIESLIADLKSDQQVLAQHILQVKSGLSMMDSMITFLNTPSLIAGKSGQLYYFARFAPRLKPLSINNRTLEQLKNSGNFRLIKNLATSNKIMKYYDQLPLIHLLESISETEFKEYKTAAVKIFDANVFLKMEDENGDIKRIADNPPLRSFDNQQLQELSAFSVYMQADKKTIIKISKDLKTEGSELIEYLQKEYHLE
jgi:hypothetical protein